LPDLIEAIGAWEDRSRSFHARLSVEMVAFGCWHLASRSASPCGPNCR